MAVGIVSGKGTGHLQESNCLIPRIGNSHASIRAESPDGRCRPTRWPLGITIEDALASPLEALDAFRHVKGRDRQWRVTACGRVAWGEGDERVDD